MPGLLDALFGGQGMPQGQQPQDMIQGILSARFQPQMQDVGEAALRTGIGGQYTSPSAVAVQNMAPLMDVYKSIGPIMQQRLEIAKIDEMMRHNRAIENANPNLQPITTQPTISPQPSLMGDNGGGMPSPQPMPVQNPPMDMRGVNNSSGPGIPVSDQMVDNELNQALVAGNGGRGQFAPLTSPVSIGGQIGEPTPEQLGAMPVGGSQPSQQQNVQKSNLKPLFRGSRPYTEGAQPGFQWALDQNGQYTQMQVPGTIQKGANGEILSVGPDGKVTQQIPVNPQARQKLESNLSLIAQKFDELHNIGGTVETDGPIIGNKINQLQGTKDWAWGKLPGGQTLMQGTKLQTIRGEIQDLVKQTTPLYMQAMGITPGMERAVSAQQMLQEALGGAVTNTRQQNLFSLANLSNQAGTGDLAKKLQSSVAPKNGGGWSIKEIK